ncbi:hypothetical protein [Streptomyces sp. NPDC094468]|uniref:hypothetical protein n=1 Tax=Streptomyces sp. NPDC094468 TaxID=3366066 RepID=UPI0037FC4126
MPSQPAPSVVGRHENKPYQCPQCHTDTIEDLSRWKVYTCCNCSTRFARFPRLERFLRHVGVTCEHCTGRLPVTVDGEPFGYLRRRHSGIGTYAGYRFEAWLYDPDRPSGHPDGARYINTGSSRTQAVADLAYWRSFLGRTEDDLSPVVGVVADEEFNKYSPDLSEAEQTALQERSLEVYGVGALRSFPAGHRRHGQFYGDTKTFTWGIIAPYGLEGIYTTALPASLAAHAPQL